VVAAADGGRPRRTLEQVTETPTVPATPVLPAGAVHLTLDHDFATAVPELALPWRAAEAPDPRLVVLNDALARDLGLDPDELRSPDGVRLLVGAAVPEGARPVAQGYAGHQFGGFSPRLGDGRALLLGELTTPDGAVRDLHLKGSGRTPFARGGDGLAALGPMLREHLVSEGMHALGVPTTRSLAVLATGRRIQRDAVEPGGVLARVAASHLRVGSFQYARTSDDPTLLRRLADHAIARHHPHLAGTPEPYAGLYGAVVAAQARLVAQWVLLGFVHGVMNTDNMTISGETIDYGPCAFVDGYDPGAVFSSIDTGGRYALGNQPAVAQWNLARFAEALLPLLDDDQERAIARATELLGTFPGEYVAAWASGMRAKLGLAEPTAGGPTDEETLALAEGWQGILASGRVDWTSSFRALADAGRGNPERLRGMVLDLPELDAWLERWRALGPDPAAMDRANPVYVPRNHLVEEALAAARDGDLAPTERLLEALAAPYDERPGLERYAEPSPDGLEGYRTFCGT
jgi:uncharacterized protein YdiU (UPF0061 family)